MHVFFLAACVGIVITAVRMTMFLHSVDYISVCVMAFLTMYMLRCPAAEFMRDAVGIVGMLFLIAAVQCVFIAVLIMTMSFLPADNFILSGFRAAFRLRRRFRRTVRGFRIFRCRCAGCFPCISCGVVAVLTRLLLTA